jgi:hypothetical protein
MSRAECRNLFIVMLNVVMLNVIMLNVIMLNVIMLKVIMLNVIVLNVIMLKVIMLNVIVLNVVRLSVVAPTEMVYKFYTQGVYLIKRFCCKFKRSFLKAISFYNTKKLWLH